MKTGRMSAGVAIVCVCALGVSLTGCIGSGEHSLSSERQTESSSDEERQSAALTQDPSTPYTELTPQERREATKARWEEPGNEKLRPPQSVLDSRKAGDDPPTASPERIQQVQEFENQWEQKRNDLLSRGWSEAQIAQRRAEFKANFFKPAQ